MFPTAWAWSWIGMQGNTSGEIYQTHPQPTQACRHSMHATARVLSGCTGGSVKVSGWHQVFDQKTWISNFIICVEDNFFCQEHIEVTLLCWSHLNVVWTKSLVAVWLPSKYLACSGFLRTGSRPVERDVTPLHDWEGGPTRSLLLFFFLLTPERKGISRRSWTPPHSWMQTTATLQIMVALTRGLKNSNKNYAPDFCWRVHPPISVTSSLVPVKLEKTFISSGLRSSAAECFCVLKMRTVIDLSKVMGVDSGSSSSKESKISGTIDQHHCV